jgi:hypothetical protein
VGEARFDPGGRPPTLESLFRTEISKRLSHPLHEVS